MYPDVDVDRGLCEFLQFTKKIYFVIFISATCSCLKAEAILAINACEKQLIAPSVDITASPETGRRGSGHATRSVPTPRRQLNPLLTAPPDMIPRCCVNYTHCRVFLAIIQCAGSDLVKLCQLMHRMRYTVRLLMQRLRASFFFS